MSEIDERNRRIAAKRRLQRHADLEKSLAAELHALTLRRQELNEQLAQLRSQRGTLIMESRNDLYLTVAADLLGVSRDTARSLRNAEMKRRGIGVWDKD
jgi:cell division protein FtsB